MTKKKDIPQSEEGWGNVELPGLSDEELYSKNWNRVAAGRELAQDPSFQAATTASNRKKAKDPKWIEAHAEAALKRAKDPNWRASVSEANKKKAKDPKWIEAHAEACRKTLLTTAWKEAQKEGARKNAQDPVWKAAQAEACKKRAFNLDWVEKQRLAGIAKRKPVVTPIGIFESKAIARLSLKNIDWSVTTKPDEYFYITQEGFARLKLITDPAEFQKQLLIEKQVYKDVKAAKKK